MTTMMKVSTPELLWHGGANENGKPDPVFSIDFHPCEPVMLSTGIDAAIPPKGSVRVCTHFSCSLFCIGLLGQYDSCKCCFIVC
jgi:hypothetical protein